MPSAIFAFGDLVLYLSFFFSLNHLYFGLNPKFLYAIYCPLAKANGNKWE
jgi:hypothetical protein